MNIKDFSELLNRRIELTKSVLDKKSQEYSIGTDKLYNFKKTATMRDKHPCEALQGMMDKHLTSYFDMVNGIQNGKKYTREYIDEKFGDIINYFILQEALFVEIGLVEQKPKINTNL